MPYIYIYIYIYIYSHSFELCFGSLSSCKTKFCPIMWDPEEIVCLCCIAWYFPFCIIPLIWTKSPAISSPKHLQTITAAPPCLTIGPMQFSLICSEGVVCQTLFIYFKKAQIWTFFQSLLVLFTNLLKSNPCAVVLIVIFSLYFSFLIEVFLTGTHLLSRTESLLLTVIADIGCWHVELNSAVSLGAVLHFLLLDTTNKCQSSAIDVTSSEVEIFVKFLLYNSVKVTKVIRICTGKFIYPNMQN